MRIGFLPPSPAVYTLTPGKSQGFSRNFSDFLPFFRHGRHMFRYREAKRLMWSGKRKEKEAALSGTASSLL
jgi:hypothetical protein